jgi:CHAT domain-containing protein/tetratricopeptide (TPR) repeat protein
MARGTAPDEAKPGVPPSSAAELLALPDDAARRSALQARPELVTPELQAALAAEAEARRRRNDLVGSVAAYRLAADVAERRGDRRVRADLLAGSARVLVDLGEFEPAMDATRVAEALYRELGLTAQVAWVLTGQGIVRRRQGDFDAALALYEESLRLTGEGDVQSLARYLNNIGLVHGERGDLRSALSALERSLTLKSEGGLDYAHSLNNIGKVHDLQGDLDLALSFYERARQVYTRRGEQHEEASLYVNIGTAHATRGDLPRARAALEKALAADRRADAVCQALAWLSKVALAEGRPAEAQSLAERGVALAREKNLRPQLASGLEDLAGALLAGGKRPEALAAAQEGSALAEQLRIPGARIANLNVEGRASLALGRREAARRAWQAAIEEVEAYRERVAGGAQERQRFFEAWLAPYHHLLDLRLSEGAVDDALAYAERARARALAEVLQQGQVRVTLSLSPEERAEERALEARLTALQRRAPPAAAPGTMASGERPSEDVLEARRALEAFRVRLFARHPELRLARAAAPVVRVQEAHDLVSDGRTAVLLYTVAPKATYLFVLASVAGRPELTAHRIPTDAGVLRKKVEAFRGALAARDLDLGAGRELHRLLMGPAHARLAGRSRLIVIPDGPLWELPFQALQPRPGRFLLEDAAVGYAPSLTVLQALRRRPSAGNAAPSLLAFGNPTGGPDAAPLPEAERQVRALAALYGSRATSYLGAEARESRAKAEAGHHGVLHFAAHGLLDDASPMYSALLMAAEPSGSADDGRLEARELINLPLQADLAVLSACETARGRVGAGEGMIGLSWALLMAGSANVVVSQWRVDAASTEDLMVGLHRRLQAPGQAAGPEVDVPRALREAALAVRSDPRYRHPFYWAGFTLVGSGTLPARGASPGP